jgi:hypothetical protein
MKGEMAFPLIEGRLSTLDREGYTSKMLHETPKSNGEWIWRVRHLTIFLEYDKAGQKRDMKV